MNKRQLLLGSAGLMILLVNALVLGGVAWNRSGVPESQLDLTQRELHLPVYSSFPEENSGLALQLQWSALAQTAQLYGGNSPAWLNHEKLRELGFTNLEQDSATGRWRNQSREVLLVLELDGPAYRAAIQQAEGQLASLRNSNTNDDEIDSWEKRVAALRLSATRLFAIDAGLDQQALRQRYPQRQQYAIVTARIDLGSQQIDDKWTTSGYINSLAGATINLPDKLRKPFAGLALTDQEPSAAYRIDVAFGQRLEPWIVSANLTP